MPFINLKVPTLVQDIKVEERRHYFLRPLFLLQPGVSNPRYDAAVVQYQREIRRSFNGFELERNNMNSLLWYQFKPELSYTPYSLQLKAGSHFIDGNFAAIQFQIQQLTFFCLPGFKNYMFIGQKDKAGELVDPAEQVKGIITKLLKEAIKDTDIEFDLKNYCCSPKDFLTEVSVNIKVDYRSFKFEQSEDTWFFSRISQYFNFDGAEELEKVGYDVSNQYPSELSRAYQVDDWVEKIYQILVQEDNTPIALVGPEGVGKHTLIQEAVWRIEDDRRKNLPITCGNIWHLDPTRVIAGMSVVGMWQKRLEAILTFVIQPNPEERRSEGLLIDNVVALLRIGQSAQNNMTLSDVLKPYLEKRQFQLIILANPEEWKVVQEKDRRFADLFQVMRITEPDMETATRIILEKRRDLESQNDMVISIGAIQQLLSIQRNYLRQKSLPGSVLKLLQQLAVKHRYGVVGAEEVRAEFKVFSGLRQHIFDSHLVLSKDEIENWIRSELVGQPRAVQALANVIHLIKAKLNDPGKPLGSFLFIGPTGVGKTQAAKVLCKFLMGNEDHLLRFDMNEYIDESAVPRLIGDYYNPEGQLTGKVRYKPFGILLLDEIEKAHTKVHDLLLQVLDDGRLTDSLGRTVDFSNTIIIMTSNVGVKEAGMALGFDRENREESLLFQRAVENHFRPEFINRIDQMVIFDQLEIDHICSIANLQIKELLQRDGFVRRTTIVNISQDALEWVARRGYDSRMGGRALKRQIERDLTTLSAEQLIATSSEKPILFDIFYKDGKLLPNITFLEFTSLLPENWMAHIPDRRSSRKTFTKLFHATEALEEQVKSTEEGQDIMVFGGDEDSTVNYDYYQFLDTIVEFKELLQRKSLRFPERNVTQPLRLKWSLSNAISINGLESSEAIINELLPQETLKELRDLYYYASTQFDSQQSEFINSYLDLAFFKLFSKGHLKQEIQEVKLCFESCITGLGDWEIQYLMDLYTGLFKSLNIQYQCNIENQKEIVIKGYSVKELLIGELGIHLFYKPHQNPLPIRVKMFEENILLQPEHQKIVIRIYDSNQTLTDLRSGLSNVVQLSINEFKVLVFAGLPAKIRKEIEKI